MKHAERFKLNNKGASLLFVIISFVFIAALGSIVVSSAITNVEMKRIHRQSKQTFYSADQALNEVKVSLTEDVAKSLADAYEEVLSKFSSTDEASRKALFQDYFVNQIKTTLNVDIVNEIECERFNQVYLKEMKYNADTGNGAKVFSTRTGNKLGFVLTDGVSVTISGLKIICYNKGYANTLSTDIKILLPSSSFISPVLTVDNKAFMDYSLIANKGLWATTSSHNVLGNVYAGEDGINVSNESNTLTMQNGNVISAGDITIKDKAKLNITAPTFEIWAKNLITAQTNKSEQPLLTTDISINGKTFIKDDLVIDANSSKVNLAGEYYGYSSGDSASSNSAITINMANAFLKMDLLNKLYLAGRAYLSFNNGSVSYDPNSSVGAPIGANNDVQTGESLSVKGSQTAYLLPPEYIEVGHNPVSWDEYTTYYNQGTSMYHINSTDVIFKDSSIADGERKLSDYVNISDPVNSVFYKFGSESNVVYYYLKFKNEKLATTFFKNYSICYPEKVYNNFPINKIIVNSAAGTNVTAGNLITYNNSATIVQGSNTDFNDPYGNQYNNLSHTLQKYVSSTKSVFETILNVDKINQDAIGGKLAHISDGVLSDGSTHYYVNIVNGDFTLDETGKQGIIIATGDVNVKYDFTGLIIAGKNINLQSGADVQANGDLVNKILDKNPNVKAYFAGEDESGDTEEDWSALDISKLIVYENWRKN